MMIDEKIETMKRKITKVLEENSSASKETIIQLLEELGIQAESATNLLSAYGEMESAKRTAQNVWNTARGPNKAGIDFSTDIRKSSDAEARWTRHFDSVKSKCALLMAIKHIDPNEINEGFLDRLSQEGIQENEITNPALKITYHYYNESKAKDAEVARVKKMAKNEKDLYEYRLGVTEKMYDELNKNYRGLQDKYEDLQTKFEEKEKSHQSALSQIETLKSKLMELQNRGIFRTIADKLKGIFGNKAKELPKVASKSFENSYNNDKKNDFRKGLEVSAELLEASTKETQEPKQTDRDEWYR